MNQSNIKQILHNLKIEELNAMQQALSNPELRTKDIILLSPTGSGKTLGFLLPLLNILVNNTTSVQTMILAPSRELALQIDSVFKSMKTMWKSYCCYGGHSFQEEKKSLLQNTPSILIGTPGRIADHIRRGNIIPTTIQTLIIDEFDKSLELGFEDEMEEIISQLTSLKKRMLISATDMEVVPAFTRINSPVKLNFLNAENEEERLKLWRVSSPEKDKIDTLFKLLSSLNGKQSIVFANHRDSAQRIHKLLKEKGIYGEIYHGGMEQPERELSLIKFRNGSSNVLISTDLASRGLDIPAVEHIIHYHLPVNEEAFTHRNGRTARWERKGDSYLIINESESLPDYLSANIEEYMFPEKINRPSKPEWVTIYIGRGKKDKLNKVDVVGFLYKKGMLSREDVGPVEVKEHTSFVAVKRNKVNQLLTLVSGEKIKGMKTIFRESHN
ncbi:DEAD/DEAH box helicase [Bacteroides sp. 519]|uniref:DEAD/DEAH box helicase n=1 Tax=Bacteroides sp. 519 TaxID=2302937 RepID=UPI0013D4A977|nr:DEAD/DEAH box helicase [Bacteroides sp. 519]NDV58539.1 ATP-dependent helicase [Bacteroides sp. 519]